MNLKYQFPIESDRLIFKALKTSDYLAWEAFFTDNNQLHFVGITNPEPAHVESQKWIDRQIKRYETSGFGILGAFDKVNDQLIGNCGLIWRKNILGENLFEIGYAVVPEKWANGLASEMSNRFMQYFIEHQLGNKVISIIAIDNLASQQIALKNGMKKGPQFKFQGAQCFQFYRLLTNH